jgi:hypothetical protein
VRSHSDQTCVTAIIFPRFRSLRNSRFSARV